MKVLIIRFSSIGDIVLTTPIIRTVKQQLGAEVHFLCFQRFQNLVVNNPYIDKIHTLDREMSPVIATLKDENYDLVIDLHKNLRTRRIKYSLGVKSISFDKVNIQKWIYVNFKIDRLPQKHIVDRYFDAVATLGVKNDGKGLDFFFPTDMRSTGLEQVLSEISKLPSFVVIVLGATYYTKRIPVSLLSELIRLIHQPIVFIGGKDVLEISQQLKSSFPEKDILDYCGKISIDASAMIISKASKIITGDTGMMHIAAALKKPILSIWGSTSPRFGMYPYYGKLAEDQNLTMEVSDLSCRPCSKLGYDECPKGHFECMNNQKTLG